MMCSSQWLSLPVYVAIASGNNTVSNLIAVSLTVVEQQLPLDWKKQVRCSMHAHPKIILTKTRQFTEQPLHGDFLCLDVRGKFQPMFKKQTISIPKTLNFTILQTAFPSVFERKNRTEI